MITVATIREDLRDIKYYCARKKMFEERLHVSGKVRYWKKWKRTISAYARRRRDFTTFTYRCI